MPLDKRFELRLDKHTVKDLKVIRRERRKLLRRRVSLAEVIRLAINAYIDRHEHLFRGRRMR